ncbi:MAG TPA: ABC transporter permease [Acidimicrobiales bacterium]|nr:ABC transporter permease [Acidimicrobiales bacterium]
MPEMTPERPAAPGLAGMGGGAVLTEPAEPVEPIEAVEDGRVPSAEQLGVEESHLSPRRLALRRFSRHKLAMGSLFILIVLTALCVLAPLITAHGYAYVPRGVQSIKLRLKGPSLAHPFGTDTIGRDQWSRVLYGGRVSLAVGLGVALSGTIIGTFVGSVAGFFGGRLDNFLMRITDLFLGMPLLVILILASKAVGGSVLDIVLILSIFFWMPIARIVRGLFLSLKEKEYVEAARSMGASNFRIMFRHILPNCVGPIIVNATLSVAGAILTESVLSFLGRGVQPPVPTWGNLLDSGRRLQTIAPYLVWFPGLGILITVLCVNFVGDGLRDALDPTQRRVRA